MFGTITADGRASFSATTSANRPKVFRGLSGDL